MIHKPFRLPHIPYGRRKDNANRHGMEGDLQLFFHPFESVRYMNKSVQDEDRTNQQQVDDSRKQG